MLKKLTVAAVGAAFMFPAAGAAAASADAPSQRDAGDRYELASAKSGAVAQTASRPNRKSGMAAARTVERVAKRIGRRYDLECRVYQTQLGARGVVECKGSTRGKRELSRQIRRLVREGKIVPPEDSGYYIGVWSPSSQKVVRIDWVRFGFIGTPA